MWQVMGRSKLGLLEGWFCRWLRNCSDVIRKGRFRGPYGGIGQHEVA
jgi:hypothetical protein